MPDQLTGHDADPLSDKTDHPDYESYKTLISVDGGPQATITRAKPGTTIPRHFHTQDQWQIFLEGSGTMEGEDLEPFTVHYTKAETAYGPIEAGEDGLTFMTLREAPAGYHPVGDEE